MRRLFGIRGIVFLSAGSFLSIGMPYWVKKLPKSSEKTYYYRVTKAEGKTYEEAYARAFSMAILESSWKLGVTVDPTASEQTIEQPITSSINIQNDVLVLPLNKVCEYETKAGNRVTLYILWQVARFGNVDPKFEDFTECEQ